MLCTAAKCDSETSDDVFYNFRSRAYLGSYILLYYLFVLGHVFITGHVGHL